MTRWIRDGLRSPRHIGADATGWRGDTAWWHVMGYAAGPPHSLDQVERRFRRLAAEAHPDRGGSCEQLQRLLRARALARRQLTPGQRA